MSDIKKDIVKNYRYNLFNKTNNFFREIGITHLDYHVHVNRFNKLIENSVMKENLIFYYTEKDWEKISKKYNLTGVWITDEYKKYLKKIGEL